MEESQNIAKMAKKSSLNGKTLKIPDFIKKAKIVKNGQTYSLLAFVLDAEHLLGHSIYVTWKNPKC